MVWLSPESWAVFSVACILCTVDTEEKSERNARNTGGNRKHSVRTSCKCASRLDHRCCHYHSRAIRRNGAQRHWNATTRHLKPVRPQCCAQLPCLLVFARRSTMMTMYDQERMAAMEALRIRWSCITGLRHTLGPTAQYPARGDHHLGEFESTTCEANSTLHVGAFSFPSFSFLLSRRPNA